MTEGKSMWPELVNTPAREAGMKIMADNPNVTSISFITVGIIDVGTNFVCTRVRIFVDPLNGLIASTPMIG